MQDFTSAKSSGTKISSRAARANHLPDALIQRTPSSFTEVFPEPACASSGLQPKRADTPISAWISEWLVPGTVPARLPALQYVIDVNSADPRKTGTSSSGIGLPSNSFRHGTASQRATCVALCLRALSVEMPVVAYIWRYNLEINKNASRSRSLDAHFDRCQISRR